MLFDKVKRFVPLLVGILFLTNILAWLVVFDLSRPRLLEVALFDVGQGDTIFIETPQGHQILIDGGPDSTVLEKLGKEMPFWDREIDLIILTHPDFDHLIGLIEVLKNYKVANILWTGIEFNNNAYEDWLKIIAEEEAKIIIARAGQRIKAGEVILEIVYPFENLKGKRIKDTNNSSIVSRLVFKEVSFLFLGDIYKSAEKEIADKNENLDSDVLKISHHGSKSSSDEEFIRRVSPEIGLISVGKDNNYGHPHQEVLEIMKKYDIKILRTDLDGDIKIFSDGENLTI